MVLCCAGDIDHVRPAAILHRAGSSTHHVRVDIDRIDRIGHADAVVVAQHVADVAAVALGTVADKYLARL